MKKKLLLLAVLPAVALCALAATPPPPDDIRIKLNGTILSSSWESGPASSGAAFAVEVKLSSGSPNPGTKWSIDNNPSRWDIGTIVTGVSCANHTVKFFPPSGHSGPPNQSITATTANDNQKRVITVKYQ